MLRRLPGTRIRSGQPPGDQRDAFDCITADWSERDRFGFARPVLKYVASLDQLRDRGPAGETKG